MNSKTKLLVSLIIFISLAIASCGSKFSFPSEEKSDTSVQPTAIETTSSFSVEESSSFISSLTSEQSISQPSLSENNWSSHFETTCKDGLHDYVKCMPVEDGHKKYCEKCNLFIGEKEEHAYFNDEYLYCPTCGFYDAKLTKYPLTEDFNVVVKTANGNITRKILSNIYKTTGGVFFTLSSPSNAHGSYIDSDI